MGVNIGAEVYEIDKLKSALEAHYDKNIEHVKDKMRPAELLDILMPKFGLVKNGLFILVYNEYWEDFTPVWNFRRSIEKYYGPKPDAKHEDDNLFDFFSLKNIGETDVNGGVERIGKEEADEWGIPNWPEDEDGEY